MYTLILTLSLLSVNMSGSAGSVEIHHIEGFSEKHCKEAGKAWLKYNDTSSNKLSALCVRMRH